MTYLSQRKTKLAMTVEECWALLESKTVSYGILATSGVKSEECVPYAVPMNFAADRVASAIYIHTTIDSGSKRKKAVSENPRVSFVVVDPESSLIFIEINPSSN